MVRSESAGSATSTATISSSWTLQPPDTANSNSRGPAGCVPSTIPMCPLLVLSDKVLPHDSSGHDSGVAHAAFQFPFERHHGYELLGGAAVLDCVAGEPRQRAAGPVRHAPDERSGCAS